MIQRKIKASQTFKKFLREKAKQDGIKDNDWQRGVSVSGWIQLAEEWHALEKAQWKEKLLTKAEIVKEIVSYCAVNEEYIITAFERELAKQIHAAQQKKAEG